MIGNALTISASLDLKVLHFILKSRVIIFQIKYLRIELRLAQNIFEG